MALVGRIKGWSILFHSNEAMTYLMSRRHPIGRLSGKKQGWTMRLFKNKKYRSKEQVGVIELGCTWPIMWVGPAPHFPGHFRVGQSMS